MREESVPWFNAELVSLSKKKYMYLRRARTCGLKSEWDKFKKYNNNYAKVYRNKKQAYYYNITLENKPDSKKMWNSIKIFPHPNASNEPSNIVYNGKTYDQTSELLELFANFFRVSLGVFVMKALEVCFRFSEDHFRCRVPSSNSSLEINDITSDEILRVHL